MIKTDYQKALFLAMFMVRALKIVNSRIILILIIGFIIRFLLAFIYETGDTGAVTTATELFIRGKEVYANPNVYFSPPPFALHMLSFLRLLSDFLRIPFNGFWKIFAIISDIGIASLIYLITIILFKENKNIASKNLKLYLFNPISIFISGYHGQQESVWLFMLLLAWFMIVKYKKYFFAAIFASAALAYKLPAAILIPILIPLLPTAYKRIKFIAVIVLLFIISLFPEIITSRDSLLKQVFFYGSTPGIWGIPLIAQLLKIRDIETLSSLLKIIMIFSIILVWLSTYFLKYKQFLITSMLVLSMFFIFTPGFANQYLLWPLPFLILLNSRYIKWYTIFVTFAFLHTYSLGIWPLDPILGYMAQNIYLKITNLYPYILFLPVWILFIFLIKLNQSKYEEIKS